MPLRSTSIVFYQATARCSRTVVPMLESSQQIYSTQTGRLKAIYLRYVGYLQKSLNTKAQDG
jgi:hypothetical protein